MATSNGTYVYCLAKSERKPRAAGAPAGVPGSGVIRLLEGPARTWIVVADVPLQSYGADTINSNLRDLDWVSTRALAHEAVVEFFARTCDVVPMKLFTIFRDDERATSHVGDARTLAGVFRRIAGCSEWSVRVSCAPAASAGSVAASDRARVGTSRTSGASFLREKKAQRDAARSASTAAKAAVEDVYRRLDAVAKHSVRKQSDVPGSSLMLDAAFLVPRNKGRTFEREVERLARATSKDGCELVLSGPWPAYHFVAPSSGH